MLIDIETTFDDEDRKATATAHAFAADVLRPIGLQLDAMKNPADVIAPGSPLWEAFREYNARGIPRLSGADLDPVVRMRRMVIVNEELAWGDVGLAISLGLSEFHKPWVEQSGNRELLERFCAPDRPVLACWAVTEPDHGSDSVALTESHFRDASIVANCRAKKDGDDYVINGQKAAWVSNGSIADIAVLFCTLDQSQGFSGGAVFLVPMDLPGVRRPRPLDKLGQRSLNQGEVFFDDVRVPAGYMVVGPEFYAMALEAMLAYANAAMGQLFVGLARAALEHTLEHVGNRAQGRPLSQAVRSRLFRMFTRVEAARALCRRVAAYNATNPPVLHYSVATKVFCTNASFEVASDALHVVGSDGLARGSLLEKFFRDARASLIEDGCNEVLGLMAATRLVD